MRLTGFIAILAALSAVWVALANPEPVTIYLDAVDPANSPKISGSIAIFLLASFGFGALFGGGLVWITQIKGWNWDRLRKLRRAAADD